MTDMKKILMIAGLLASSVSLSGCLAAAVGAGVVAADEISEGDGKFDPLEEAYDGDDKTDPIIDEDDD